MSTNDDSASRRGRRMDQGERRPAKQERDERWEQSSSRDRAGAGGFPDQGRDPAGQRGYSNFRHSYPQPEPAPKREAYYPEPAPRTDPPAQRYVEPPAPAFAPPPPAQRFEPEPPHLDYGGGRDDLFSRDSSGAVFEQNTFNSQGGGYQGDPYDQGRGHQPMAQPARREEPQYPKREAAPPIDDYDRGFSSRIEEEAQSARFYLADEEPQKPRAQQQERAFAPPPPPAPKPQQQYAAGAYGAQDDFDPRFSGQQNWDEEHPLLREEDEKGGALAPHGDIDEDYFADEDDEVDHLPPPKRSRKVLIAAALVGAIAVGGGGAYFYKSIKSSGGGGAMEASLPIVRADNRPMKEVPGNPGGKQFPNGEKTIYDRLTPDGQQMQPAAFAPPPSAAPQPFATASSAPANSLEDRIDEALRKAQRAGDTPPPAPAASPSRGPDQPTVVRSESYRPDGSRVDSSRPFVTPSVIDSSNGLPPPFGNAAPAPSPQLAAPFRTAAAPSAPQAAAPAPRAAPPSRTASITPVEAAAPAGGFYVSLKSSTDEKAIQRDLPALTDKYRSVLGEVQMQSKIADLGAKGVTYRAVAGPLGTRQEAMELCQKIKGVGGDKACFVTN
jgi:hypothetical protein